MLAITAGRKSSDVLVRDPNARIAAFGPVAVSIHGMTPGACNLRQNPFARLTFGIARRLKTFSLRQLRLSLLWCQTLRGQTWVMTRFLVSRPRLLKCSTSWSRTASLPEV